MFKPLAVIQALQRMFPIIDGALAYDCPCTGIVYVLAVRNAFHVPQMNYNLISSYMMRAGGVVVNDVLKIHCEDPAVDNHFISFNNSDLRIPFN